MTLIQAREQLGKYRRFGPAGPVYEILDEVRELPDGDKIIRVRILETGEEVDYRWSHASEDPEES